MGNSINLYFDSYLFKITFFLCMFPFCSFYPLYTDTQPIFLFPILIYIISLKKLFLNLINVYFLLFSIFCLFYIDLNSTAITLNKIFAPFLLFLHIFILVRISIKYVISHLMLLFQYLFISYHASSNILILHYLIM